MLHFVQHDSEEVIYREKCWLNVTKSASLSINIHEMIGFGVARAACFEHPAGVSVGCGAALRYILRPWRGSYWNLGSYAFIPSAKSAPLENLINWASFGCWARPKCRRSTREEPALFSLVSREGKTGWHHGRHIRLPAMAAGATASSPEGLSFAPAAAGCGS